MFNELRALARELRVPFAVALLIATALAAFTGFEGWALWWLVPVLCSTLLLAKPLFARRRPATPVKRTEYGRVIVNECAPTPFDHVQAWTEEASNAREDEQPPMVCARFENQDSRPAEELLRYSDQAL